MAKKSHHYHVKAGAWHHRRYQQYLQRGERPVADFCGYWRIVLIKQPSYNMNQRWCELKRSVPQTPLEVVKYIRKAVWAVVALAWLALFAYTLYTIADFIYKHKWMRYTAIVVAVVTVLAWAMKMMVRSRGNVSAKGLALKPLRAVARMSCHALESAIDTAHFATAVVNSKKRGSLVCPLLIFDEPEKR